MFGYYKNYKAVNKTIYNIDKFHSGFKINEVHI